MIGEQKWQRHRNSYRIKMPKKKSRRSIIDKKNKKNNVDFVFVADFTSNTKVPINGRYFRLHNIIIRIYYSRRIKSCDGRDGQTDIVRARRRLEQATRFSQLVHISRQHGFLLLLLSIIHPLPPLLFSGHASHTGPSPSVVAYRVQPYYVHILYLGNTLDMTLY